jgi:LPXTG-motif cell wall-anchored protein
MSRRARWWAALVAVCALLVPVSVASAHGGNPNYRSIIDGVTPTTPDVEFQVLDYDSYMQVIDQGGHEVVIDGYRGEPYARILEDGTVEVNQRSPATYLNDSRFAVERVPPIADPTAPPQWKQVSDSGTFIWHDHRMHYMSESTPPQITDKGQKTKVFDYAIPISVDGRKGDIDGTLWWVGEAGTSTTPFIVVGVVIVLGGGLLVLFLRRRRYDEDDEGGDGSGGGGDGRGEGSGDDESRRKPIQPVGEAW